MATVPAWGKPGAWALDSEQHEAQLIQEKEEEAAAALVNNNNSYTIPHHQQQQQAQPLSDFPSLSMAAATKTKKKKPQTISLAEFSTGKSVSHGSAKSATQIGEPKGLTPDELLILPTGPRERTAEELERSRAGGFRSYGDGGRSMGPRGGGGDDRRNRDSNREPSGPSRADETDDWGAGKKSFSGFDRRERGGGGGGGFFENSQSRADESDSWVSKKSFLSSEPRRNGGGFGERRGGGFEGFGSNGGGADSETWGRREEGGGRGFQRESLNGGGADSETWGRRREEGGARGFPKESLNGGADSDTWGKKREEVVANGGGARPRLVLQPRTVPVSPEEQRPGSGSGSRSKGSGSNPFGEARPREEVLKEKGQDWKKIDEQLEAVKIKEISAVASDAPSFGRKSLGSGNGRTSPPEDRTERSWKKVVLADASIPRIGSFLLVLHTVVAMMLGSKVKKIKVL